MAKESGLVVFTVNEDSGLTQTHQDVEARGSKWEVVTEWEARGGRLEPVSVTVRSVDDGPVTGDVMRSIPIGTLHREARAEASSALRGLQAAGANFTEVGLAMVPGLPDLAVGPRRGIVMSDDDLAQVAAVYRKAWNEGRSVTEAVAEDRRISRSTAGKRIMKARQRGLLDGVGRSTR